MTVICVGLVAVEVLVMAGSRHALRAVVFHERTTHEAQRGRLAGPLAPERARRTVTYPVEWAGRGIVAPQRRGAPGTKAAVGMEARDSMG